MARSRVYLKSGRDHSLVDAWLHDELNDEHLSRWQADWQQALRDLLAQRSNFEKPEDLHWDWKGKMDEFAHLLSVHTFAITVGASLEGMMLASDTEAARLAGQRKKPLVYVKYVATAPWNRESLQTPPRHRGVGKVFIATAIRLSQELGYQGRIGLHALPEAEYFYRVRCAMSEMGKDADAENLSYFEMTAEQADSFLNEAGRR